MQYAERARGVKEADTLALILAVIAGRVPRLSRSALVGHRQTFAGIGDRSAWRKSRHQSQPSLSWLAQANHDSSF